MTLLFFMLREVTSASEVKGVEMPLVVDQCQQPMQGCIGNSSENSITGHLLSSDFWPLTDVSVF